MTGMEDAAQSRIGILQQVASGQLTAQQASEMLARMARGEAVTAPEVRAEAQVDPAPSEPETVHAEAQFAPEPVRPPGPQIPAPTQSPAAQPQGEARWFHVRVSDLESGRARVHVNIPLSWVRFGLRLGGRFAPEIGGIDWNEIAGPVSSGARGHIIDVADFEDGERVEIYVD